VATDGSMPKQKLSSVPLTKSGRESFVALASVLACVCAALLAPAAPAASASSAMSRRATVSSSPCSTSGLVIWLANGFGNGTAGSVYYKLEITNLSGRACTLEGFPGVVAVDLSGRRLGAKAQPEPGKRPRLAKLVKGASATVQLRIVEAGAISPSVCRPAMAAGLRVSPPGQTSSRLVPLPFEACSRGSSVLSVGPVRIDQDA
jgi:hypothetical protein